MFVCAVMQSYVTANSKHSYSSDLYCDSKLKAFSLQSTEQGEKARRVGKRHGIAMTDRCKTQKAQ